MKSQKNSQMHGKIFEDQFKVAFRGASDSSRTHNSFFDIEKKFDKFNEFKKLPTSIKTTKNKTVCLADARRIFSINEEFRLLVLQYEQVGEEKLPKRIFEFFPTTSEWNSLKLGLEFDDVKSFHDELVKYAVGEHDAARIWAKKKKKELQKIHKLSKAKGFELNPKIDSKRQRRLQCSIKLDVLLEKIENKKIYDKKDDADEIRYGEMFVSKIISPKRNA